MTPYPHSRFHKQCVRCGVGFIGYSERRYCGDACRRKAAKDRIHPSTEERHMTGDEAERQLQEALRMECAPPWVKHHQPWDNINVVRR